MSIRFKACKDNICKKLDNKQTRRKAEGTLEKNDCDNEKVFFKISQEKK